MEKKIDITIEQAFENVVQVVRAFKGTADEHHVLQTSLQLIADNLKAHEASKSELKIKEPEGK